MPRCCWSVVARTGPHWSRWPGSRRPGDVVFAGTVPWSELPAHYAAGDVFAMPCRTRRAGLDVEGLGIVYLEASATGLPVLAGDSGGAPDAVLDGETGYVVAGAGRRGRRRPDQRGPCRSRSCPEAWRRRPCLGRGRLAAGNPAGSRG